MIGIGINVIKIRLVDSLMFFLPVNELYENWYYLFPDNQYYFLTLFYLGENWHNLAQALELFRVDKSS